MQNVDLNPAPFDLDEFEEIAFDSGDLPRIAIIAARFNEVIVEALINGALAVLERYGIDQAHTSLMRVPGAFELPLAVELLLQQRLPPAAVIALGAVIRGDTPHFHFISQECCRGLMEVGLRHRRPVALGVLTTDTLQQARARADGFGNKGGEAALTALHMVAFARRLARDDQDA